ncbi:MAG TPA: hypothetical protein VMP11_17620 [Verrucomicrobiae bacterium]|nr:hypothetical protein [Verrucomicrobiae bacterium]
MTRSDIARALQRAGCPPDKCEAMAKQLDRRALMDAARRGVSYESALQHLLGLMAQGWAGSANRPGK